MPTDKQRKRFERKRKAAERGDRRRQKLVDRAANEFADVYMAALERWNAHAPTGTPLIETCPSCKAPVRISFEGGKIHPGHTLPACPPWLEVLEQAFGARNARVEHATRA